MRKPVIIILQTSFDQMVEGGSIHVTKDALVIDLTKVILRIEGEGGKIVTFRRPAEESIKRWNLKEKLPQAAKLLEGEEARKMRLAQFFTEERLAALGASRAAITKIRNLIIANPQVPALKGVFTVDALVSRVTHSDLLRIDNIGPTTVNLIQAALSEVGLQLYKAHFLGPPH